LIRRELTRIRLLAALGTGAAASRTAAPRQLRENDVLDDRGGFAVPMMAAWVRKRLWVEGE
jgi:hypothetical protein